MKKRIAILGLIFVLVLCNCPKALAYGADEHNAYLMNVLGGEYIFDDETWEVLNASSMLCLDQYNGNGIEELTILKEAKVKGIPKDVSEINFKGNQTHRQYTHKGWNYDYSSVGDPGNWNERKRLLEATVNEVFSFSFFSGTFGLYSADCENMSELIYYVHIIGDYIQSFEDNTSIEYLMPLTGGTNEPTIFSDIYACLAELFDDATSTNTYIGLISDLQRIETNFEELYDEEVPYTDDKYDEYTTDLMKTLTRSIPILLRNEDFYSGIVY